MSFFTPIRTVFLPTTLALGLTQGLTHCGGTKFTEHDSSADSGVAGAAGLGGGGAGMGASVGMAGTAGQGGVAGMAGQGGVAGTAGQGGVAGMAGDGGVIINPPDPNDQPLIARPELNQTFYGPRIYVRAEPGPNQVAAQILSYEICYGFGDPTEITASPDCPASAMRLSTTTGTAALLVLDDERRSSGEKVRDYFIKARAVKSDSTNPLSAWSEVRQVTSDLSFLVAWYTFDEDIGNTQQVTDFSGNGNHGVLISDNADATQGGIGIIGQALIADGTNDYVDVSPALNNLIFDANGEISVEARIRIDALVNSQTIFGMFNTAGLQPGIKVSADDFGGQLGLRALVQDTRMQPGDDHIELAYNTTLDTFHHALMTYFVRGSTVATVDFFQDGVSGGACPCLGFTFTGTEFDAAGIGASIFGSGAVDLFDGLIDEVAIYKRALTPEEVDNNYRAVEVLAGDIP